MHSLFSFSARRVHCQSLELITRYLQPGIAEEQKNRTLPSSWGTSVIRLPCSEPTPAGLLAPDHLVQQRPGRISDCSTNPPTDPDVRISLIRFLGAARFHTARMPLDAASRIIRLRPLTKAFGYRHVFMMTCSPFCPNHGRSVDAEGRMPRSYAGTSASPICSARHGD